MVSEPANVINIGTNGGIDSQVDMSGPLQTQVLKLGDVYIIPKEKDGKMFLEVTNDIDIHEHINYE